MDDGEVERVEAFHRRKMRGADAALDHAPFAIDEFEFGETQQKADMIEPLARGLCGEYDDLSRALWIAVLTKFVCCFRDSGKGARSLLKEKKVYAFAWLEQDGDVRQVASMT
jgi:hypothetical protein